MSAESLLTSPRWRASDLGLPMPDSAHAVSACLPLWEHNIRYEEGDPEVINRLQAAYPRFCLNPFVRELCRRVFGGDNRGLVFPSAAAADRAVEYCRSRGAASAVIGSRSGELGERWASAHQGSAIPTAVSISADQFSTLKEYWQHSGEVLTSRAAELLLNEQAVTVSESSARELVRQRIADLHDSPVDHVFLHLCGMAAISSAWRAIRTRDGVSPSVQFGFPYVDTLKIQERFVPAAHAFYAHGDADELDQLASLLKRQRVCAVFCEAPTNPLLKAPDLQALRQLADAHDFVLVVDDTLTACINQRLLPLADVVVTSLTKYFSGYGDVLAGSCVVNANSRQAAWLLPALRSAFEELLPDADADVLERNSRDVRDRVRVINRNAAGLASWLRQQPHVAEVFYPDQPDQSVDGASEPAAGGLLSIVLHHPERSTAAFFDALEVCKGPNLGTNFTLCCPYTILAHFTEFDFVERCGVSRWLLRISVGTEPLDELRRRFDAAFRAIPSV